MPRSNKSDSDSTFSVGLVVAVILIVIVIVVVIALWVNNSSSSSSSSTGATHGNSVGSKQTIDGTQTQSGAPILVPIYGRPDMTINFDTPPPSLTWETFDSKSCDVAEGSVPVGRQRLLRYTALLNNIGNAPLFLGLPSEDPAFWEFSACHGHYHRKDVVDTRLLDSRGKVVATGRKIAFCMQDTMPTHMPADDLYSPTSWARFQSCANAQGLSNGWTDVYGRDYDGNYVVITNVSAGKYTLEAEINALRPDGTRPLPYETNFANNIARLTVQISNSAVDILPPQVPNPTCATALDVSALPPGKIVLSNSFTGERVLGTDVCGNKIEIAPRAEPIREGLVVAKVWFTFVGSGGRMRASTCEEGTMFDTVLGIFTSPCTDSCEDLVCVATNDDYNGIGCGFTSKVEFPTVAGQRYWASVHGYDSDGAIGFKLDEVPEPVPAC